ncbi:MAG: SWIM zinc finger family protein [Pyrinomonadaceae bacterium]
MTPDWTPEQIIALAPDAPSARAGRGLAVVANWVTRGHDGRALWGECPGSGQNPYQTSIDLSEPAFKCTCPSRKFPCKHALGLFLLFAGQPAAFPDEAPPAWVAEWRAKRAQQASRKEAAKAGAAVREETADERGKKEAAKNKRASDRRAKVTAGLAELELWLRDLARQGLAAAQSQPARWWEQTAARLVDAQAPGAARRVREMSSLSLSGEGRAEQLLARCGLLHLLLEGFKRIEGLPAPVREDIRAAVGWAHKEDELLAGEGTRDEWLVLGQRTYEEDTLRVRRTWLRGRSGARGALVIDFAARGQVLDVGLVPGTRVDAELVFYPGNYPLRAAVKERFAAPGPFARFAGHRTIADLLTAYAEAVSRNPWLEAFPAPLAAVVPVARGERWFVRDAAARMLPVSPRFDEGWKLVALGGGHPLGLFGEWDGRELLPLGAWVGGRYVRL